MRTHDQTGKPVRIVVSRGLRDRYCSICSNGLTVGVHASAPPIALHSLFCRECATAIGRAASTIGQRTAVAS